MVTEFTIAIAFSIEFRLYKPVKMPSNQRYPVAQQGERHLDRVEVVSSSLSGVIKKEKPYQLST